MPDPPFSPPWTPVVDQHASWLALNPIQGCPKGCHYCFLNSYGLTRVAPAQLQTPTEAVETLTGSPLYGPDRAIALFTWTDVMATAANRAYLTRLLDELLRRGIANPIVLITKCRVPTETIEAINTARAAGLRVLVYLSYSGLDAGVEAGVRHEHIRGNFPALNAAGVPIVHYWRPALPASTTPERMEQVLALAAEYAVCTMAAGLKVEPDALERLAVHWPQLATTPGVSDAECVYPRPFWDFIHATADLHPDYPVFHTNSCALAYALGEADRFGVFGGPVCIGRNLCPATQRQRCAAAPRPLPEEPQIRAALHRRGIGDAAFTLLAGERELRIQAAAPNAIASALSQDLGVRVVLSGQGGDAYWSSGTSGAQPLILEVPA